MHTIESRVTALTPLDLDVQMYANSEGLPRDLLSALAEREPHQQVGRPANPEQ